METHKSIQGRFKYSHVEVVWTREELASGKSLDSVTRTFGLSLDYTETLTFEDPNAAEKQFVNWVMMASLMTDEQALALVASLMKEKDLEDAASWKR